MREENEGRVSSVDCVLPSSDHVLRLVDLHGLGNRILDRSIYGNHGTFSGATWKRLPRGLYVPSFDGSSKITIADSDLISCYSNLLTNPSFETGDPPTGWTKYGSGSTFAQSTTFKHDGDYSGKLTRVTNDCGAYQDYADPASYRGVTVTYGCWVLVTAALRAIIGIQDSDGSTASSYHSGAVGWEYLTATRTISATTTFLRCHINVLNGDTSAYFDDAVLYVPSRIALSLEAWVKATTVDKANRIFEQNGYLLRINSGNRINLQVWNGTGWSNLAGATTTIAVDTWYHFLATSTASAQVLYINGVQETTGTMTYVPMAGALTIGGATVGEQMSGLIALARISLTIKTVASALADYNREGHLLRP